MLVLAALALRPDERNIDLPANNVARKKVGVLVSTIAGIALNKRGIETVLDLFEDDLLAMLEHGGIDAAAVTPPSAGYCDLKHPKARLRVLPLFENAAMSRASASSPSAWPK